MKPLGLGIIGLSEGNGHPFSWSAICNGYDPVWMDRCGYPAIPAYLSTRNFPRDQLQGARVTHVWTQDPDLTHLVARAALIPCSVDSPEEMIGSVDGILLARDDAENHRLMAEPFLLAGLPVYIDKPLALERRDAVEMLALQRSPAQLFTCSALRYAKELVIEGAELEELGDLVAIEAIAPKDWDRYAVHAIEAMLRYVDPGDRVVEQSVTDVGTIHSLTSRHSSGLTTRITCLGACMAPIRISLHGTNGCRHLDFVDTFSAFKAALEAFILTIRESTPQIAEADVLRVVDTVERGRSSAR